ncbi:MAG TPA: membrane dipeptidase [Acidimicrobiales bacterium]|nr:membrane dipeptidase [Acidimicrobiales bacterium]
MVDAHVESFIWSRVLGYDLASIHGPGPLGGRFFSQADLPRMAEAGLTGVVLSVATNPFRRRARRTATLLANLARLRATVEAHPDDLALVTDLAGYRQARAKGRLACFLAVQGGNALASPDDLDRLPPGLLSRVTLVHLTASAVGAPSAPSPRRDGGLTSMGAALVEACNARRVIVDLAHISRRGFWDTLAVHDPSLPVVVSHTGVRGVHDVWRNIDDEQIGAVADRGGVVGIMFHSGFLGDRFWSGRADAVVRHVEHVVRVGGEDAVAIGSDFDGLIVPPRDLATVSQLPVLAQRMRDRGFSAERVGKVLGANYLRVVGEMRPGPAPTPSS